MRLPKGHQLNVNSFRCIIMKTQNCLFFMRVEDLPGFSSNFHHSNAFDNLENTTYSQLSQTKIPARPLLLMQCY